MSSTTANHIGGKQALDATVMMTLLKTLYPLRLAPVSPDTDRAIDILCHVLPFEIHEYASGSEHNGWTVPQTWYPTSASIYRNARKIYDGMEHPLGVIGYSTSFSGTVDLAELKEHLCYHPELDDSLVYHCDYFYKPWKRTWGFSVTKTFFNELESGEYEVDLETVEEPGTMKVLDYLLPGDSEDAIILNAHNCHAAQANDDIAGVVTAIEVIRRLSERASRRFSYRVVIAPEHLGTVFFLANCAPEKVKTFKHAMFLEMVGNDNSLALQESFTGKSLIDRAAHHYLKHHHPDYRSDSFRKIVGNDETVWEAPGFEIPCVSLSRFPYLQYHSNFDTIDIITPEHMTETVEAVLGIIEILETNVTVKRHFSGLMALSNPKYDLYISTIDPSIRKEVGGQQLKWNYLMDCVVRYFDGTMTILEIAEKHDLNYTDVLAYIRQFEQKGLVSLET